MSPPTSKRTCKQGECYSFVSSTDDAEPVDNNAGIDSNVAMLDGDFVVAKAVPDGSSDRITSRLRWASVGAGATILTGLVLWGATGLRGTRTTGGPGAADPPPPPPPHTLDYYLGMSDAELFQHQGGEDRIGRYCFVQVGGGACRYYVKAAPSTASRYGGWPRTTAAGGDRGTGCVYDGDRSKSCYYRDPAYDLTEAQRDSFCAPSYVANAAAQLRHALRNGACGELSGDAASSNADESESSSTFGDEGGDVAPSVESHPQHPSPSNSITDQTPPLNTKEPSIDGKEESKHDALPVTPQEEEEQDHKSWWEQATSTVSSWLGLEEESHPTKLPGGGRDWLVNAKSGTVAAKHDPSFLLGYGPGPLILVGRDSEERIVFAPEIMAPPPNESGPPAWVELSVTREDDDGNVGAEFVSAIGESQLSDGFEYYDAVVSPWVDRSFAARFKDSNYIVTEDGFVLDVAFWNIVEGSKVNFVKANDDNSTYKKGGGRDWTWNEEDGTISPKLNPDLVLGAGGRGLVITREKAQAIHLSHAQELANGETVPMELIRSGTGQNFELVGVSEKEETYGDWRYRQAVLGRHKESGSSMNPAVAVAIDVKYDGNFVLTSDEKYVLDISFWEMEPWTSVNFVRGDDA